MTDSKQTSRDQQRGAGQTTSGSRRSLTSKDSPDAANVPSKDTTDAANVTSKALSRRTTSASKDGRMAVPNQSTRSRQSHFQPHLLFSASTATRFIQLESVWHGHLATYPRSSAYSRMNDEGLKHILGLYLLPSNRRLAANEQRDVSFNILTYHQQQQALDVSIRFRYAKDPAVTKVYFFPETTELIFSVENHPSVCLLSFGTQEILLTASIKLQDQFWGVRLMSGTGVQEKHLQHFWKTAMGIFAVSQPHAEFDGSLTMLRASITSVVHTRTFLVNFYLPMKLWSIEDSWSRSGSWFTVRPEAPSCVEE